MDLSTIVIIAAYSLASTVKATICKQATKNQNDLILQRCQSEEEQEIYMIFTAPFLHNGAVPNLTIQAKDNITTTSNPMKTNTSSTPCSCSKVTQATPTSSSSSLNLILGILNVTWKNNCEGTIHLFPYPTFDSSPLPVCFIEASQVQMMLGEVCQHKRGCKNKTSWKPTKEEPVEGYNITEKGASKTTRCQKLRVHCEAEKLPDLQGELSAYKAVTALLCIVLLILLLMRFTRPTVAALQKRLSDRRQHRWVGPTQSHSVSYHRGKSAVKNDDDEEKRFSYPALERLTVGDSSPSCNRNFYNF